MNFSGAASDLAKQMEKVVEYILGLNLTPEEKRYRLARSFRLVGKEFYGKMFADNSELFDSAAIGTTGYKDPEGQVDRLASKLVQNYALSRPNERIVAGFCDSVLAQAQDSAFANAKSLGKVPTLTRRVVGETCDWCIRRAGTFTNPDGEMFTRHDDCDCLFIVKGYNSRNGVLTNYRKRRTND